MFRKLLQLLMLGLCCCGFATGAERLRIATEGAYPPFSFTNEQGQLAGFDVDIAQELCRRLNKECEIIAVSWDDLLPGLAAGRYEMIVASMAKTPEREQVADFTDSYYRTRSVFIGRPQKLAKVTPATVRGKVLATQEGTVYADYLRQHYQGAATLKLTATIPDAFTALTDGAAELVLADNLSAFEFLRSDAGQEFNIIGEPLAVDELRGGVAYLQVRKGDLRLRDSLNAALRSLWLDGAYHRINSRYFPFDIY